MRSYERKQKWLEQGKKEGISQRTQDILNIIDNIPLDPDSIYYKENLIKKILAIDKKEKSK